MTKSNFQTVDEVRGYFNKRDKTMLSEKALIVGSKNVIINDGDKVETRKGFTLDGQAKTVNRAVNGFYDWDSNRGLFVMRSFLGENDNEGKLQVRQTASNGDVTYYDVKTGLTNTDFEFSTWWSTTENQDLLLFVDGTNTLRMWSGGIAFVSSNTSTAITKTGTTTWKESGFLNTANKSVTINGVDYTYTEGETTTTLTGLLGLPTFTAGQVVTQTVVSHTSIATLPTGYTFDVIYNENNHIYLGSSVSREVYVSKSTAYNDFAYTSPVRLPTEGWKMTFDSYVTGFIQDGEFMRISGGFSNNYRVSRNMTSDGTGETFKITKIPNGSGQAPVSSRGIIPVKNGIVYITNDKTIDWVNSLTQLNTPSTLPISDPIKNDLDNYDFTNVSGKFYSNSLFVTFPVENIVLIYDFDKSLWQPPQTIPVSGFSVIDGNLYGHSNNCNETYKLFDGYNDNGLAIEHVASYAYRNYGTRTDYKEYDEYYTEAYMNSVSELEIEHNYEIDGAESSTTKNLSGADEGLKFSASQVGGLGSNPLGNSPLGGTSEEDVDLNKYRVIHDLLAVNFFEHNVTFKSDVLGARWQIVSHGGNVRPSTAQPTFIKR